MDLQTLKLFVDVAGYGSFAAAARARDMDPSAVSRAIAGLETDLGVRLMERTTRSMVLTEAGKRYLARIQPLLEDMDAATAEARDTQARPSGTVRIAASVAFGQEMVLPQLPDLRAAYPEISYDLGFSDANVDLISEGVDLALRLAPAPKGDLISSKLRSTHYRVVATPGYWSEHPLEAPEALSDHRCLLQAVPGIPRAWRFRTDDAEVSVPVSGDVSLPNALALRGAARLGLGPALLPDWLIDRDIAQGRLQAALPDMPVTATSFETGVWLLYPSRSYLPAKTRAVADFLRVALRRGG